MIRVLKKSLEHTSLDLIRHDFSKLELKRKSYFSSEKVDINETRLVNGSELFIFLGIEHIDKRGFSSIGKEKMENALTVFERQDETV